MRWNEIDDKIINMIGLNLWLKILTFVILLRILFQDFFKPCILWNNKGVIWGINVFVPFDEKIDDLVLFW